MPEALVSSIAWISHWPILVAVWVAYRSVRNWVTNRSGRFSSAETALLLLVIFAGGGLTAAANLNAALGRAMGLRTSDDIWSVTGNSYTYTETVETDLSTDAASRIEVFNLYGDVEIRPRPGNQLTLVAHKTIRASSQEEADRLNAEFSMRVKQGPEITAVRSSVDESVRLAPREWFRSNLTLWVPPDSHTRVENRWGDVIVGDSVSVETSLQHGKIRHE